ncbi:hypothetical protein D3C78_1840700 [compost metagenome]
MVPFDTTVPAPAAPNVNEESFNCDVSNASVLFPLTTDSPPAVVSERIEVAIRPGSSAIILFNWKFAAVIGEPSLEVKKSTPCCNGLFKV